MASSQQQGLQSGEAFFDGFFASALQRANMTTGQLQGRADNGDTAPSPPRRRIRTADEDEYAPDGHGLDCGTDPGPMISTDVSPTALANGVSNLNLAQTNAHAAATALLTRTAPTDLNLLAQTRGGGLGTPTGERTAIGTAWNQSGAQTPVMDKHGLGWPAKATLDRLNHTPAQADANEKRLSHAIATVLECIGEDPTRAGLIRTPERYAKALLWMTRGYEVRLSDVIANAIFDEEHDEMVIVRDIEIFSLCEHHMVPFTGKVSLAPLPRALPASHTSHTDFFAHAHTDSHWIYPESIGDWIKQVGADRRDVCTPVAGARTSDQAGSFGVGRGVASSGGGRRRRV